MTSRRGLGAILATVGALFVASSAYLDWFANRTATDIPLHRLYETSVSGDAASYWRSVALPVVLVSIIAIIALIVRSRVLFAVGWLVGAVTLVLFVAMQYNDDAVDFAFGDLQAGVWQALVASGVMLLGIVIMGGPARVEVVEEEAAVRADEAAVRADEAAARADEAAVRAEPYTEPEHRVERERVETEPEHDVEPEHRVERERVETEPEHDVEPEHRVERERVETEPEHDVEPEHRVERERVETEPEHGVERERVETEPEHDVEPEHRVERERVETEPERERVETESYTEPEHRTEPERP